MSIEKILSNLEKLKQTSKEKPVLSIYFLRKVKTEYLAYNPSVEKKLQLEIIEIIIKVLQEFEHLSEVEYSPIGTLDETIETCSVNYTSAFSKIKKAIVDNVLPDAPKDLSDFSFYLIEIKMEDDVTYSFFRRVTKFSRLKKGIVGQIYNDAFVKIDSDLIGLDANIDIFTDENEMKIFNHIAMERIFDVKEKFIESASTTLNLIKETKLIDNFTMFEKDSISDGRAIKGLTKLLKTPERVKLVADNFDKIQNVVDTLNLKIELDVKNKKIIYVDKTQLMNITYILRDAYYQSLITQRHGKDDLA